LQQCSNTTRHTAEPRAISGVSTIRFTNLFAPCVLIAFSSALAACGSPSESSPPADSNDPNDTNTGDEGTLPEDDANGNGDGDATTNPETPGLNASDVIDFPSGVTVASPVSGTVGNGAGPLGPPNPGPYAGAPRLRLMVAAPNPDPNAPLPPPAGNAYAASANAIGDVLSGKVEIAETFNLSSFFTRGGNANCYGPSLSFQNHPNAIGPDPASGQFPGGDLGIWTASTESGEACAAAQLNARMRDVQNQVSMGLMGLAGLVAAYQSTGATWPADVVPGASIDLTPEMQAAGIADVSFNVASMTLGESGEGWSYTLDMAYSAAGGGTKNILLSLKHTVTDRDAGLFEGLLTYLIEDAYTDRNCRDRPNGDITINGSVHYIKSAETSLVLQARSGTACGLASAVPSANLLDAAITSSALSGNAVNPAGGWADNFNVFTAEFDPASLLGNYSYAWQAGSGDSHTRVLAVGLETEAAGEAYFGFGESVQTSLSGQIKGFICNWAGPGNQHATPDFAKYAQRQALTHDATTGRYLASAPSDSNITYAPTNSCMYDGSGSFVYDRNVNNDLGDDSVDTAAVMTSDTVLSFDLMTLADGEADIWEHITLRGYDLPSYP